MTPAMASRAPTAGPDCDHDGDVVGEVPPDEVANEDSRGQSKDEPGGGGDQSCQRTAAAAWPGVNRAPS